MTKKFLESFPAGHYIISADGKHGNPDGNTLRAIVASRGDDEEYQIVLTNKVAGLPGLLAELSQGRRFTYVFRRSSDLSVPIELA
jgi:hypothetical protein